MDLNLYAFLMLTRNGSQSQVFVSYITGNVHLRPLICTWRLPQSHAAFGAKGKFRISQSRHFALHPPV
jgi:hypothetical protein